APVHLIEFADFGCGHCRMLYAQVHAAMAQDPSLLRMTFVNYPLNSDCNPAIKQPFHASACELAAASECAHEQGQWAALAPHLFDRGSTLDRAALVALASSLSMDGDAFASCLARPETRARVTRDAELGIAAGVEATPTFLLNGRRVVGGRPMPVFEAMLAAMKEASRP
ncbi:MAG: thioredoxin domain-containing protein, partial [Myxococcota bacterium]|nr:thioredoxin domain-containing protein [Myxococcota bacterium]